MLLSLSQAIFILIKYNSKVWKRAQSPFGKPDHTFPLPRWLLRNDRLFRGKALRLFRSFSKENTSEHLFSKEKPRLNSAPVNNSHSLKLSPLVPLACLRVLPAVKLVDACTHIFWRRVSHMIPEVCGHSNVETGNSKANWLALARP